MPLTTWRWRVVAMTGDGHVEGERGLLDAGPMRFRRYRSEVAALDAVRTAPSVARVLWFNRDFAKAELRGDELLLSDLRMGMEPDYAFSFAMASSRTFSASVGGASGAGVAGATAGTWAQAKTGRAAATASMRTIRFVGMVGSYRFSSRVGT